MIIVRNRWLDKLRKRKRDISTSPIDETVEQLIDDAQPEGDDYNQRLTSAMRKCISQLNHKEQEMIKLYYYTEMSLNAVADQMDISYGYAKQMLFRIRKRLREMLGDDPELGFVF